MITIASAPSEAPEWTTSTDCDSLLGMDEAVDISCCDGGGEVGGDGGEVGKTKISIAKKSSG